ncbi:DNA glycosylase [Crucibulum laeve]|uniref:DNA glycosylase n=1 Tax=Crucibulum laeve TaxID=68775 RepID=A0A5C3M1V7_9AGAR|nr:DNA glycosylase [Crucibulum laeve]
MVARKKRALSPAVDIQQSQTTVLASPIASTSITGSAVPAESSHKAKKMKLHESYAVESPFPNFKHPTSAEVHEVHKILSEAHPTYNRERKDPSLSVSDAPGSCKAPNVIESLIGTILSQNTTSQNSSRAKRSLDTAFGRNKFSAIVEAPKADVVEAIKQGGLANKKAATIQNILKSVKEKHGDYSLQHLAVTEGDERISDDEIMKELISYDGVGPKTASCVLLFCLGRDSFAVDTHVFRLSKMLGWVPTKADRILTQAHLDLHVPDELKYGLHVLMVLHGRTCKGCKSTRNADDCVLKDYLKKKKSERLEDEVDQQLVGE